MPYSNIPDRSTSSGVPISSDTNQESTNTSQIVAGADDSPTAPTISLNALHALVLALVTDTRYTTDIKDSGGSFNWTGSSPNFIVTIPQASHSITIQDDFGVSINLYELVAGEYIDYIPVASKIEESSGDVIINNSSNLDLYAVIT